MKDSDSQIRGLSLIQPWATLWAAGFKVHETRGRRWNISGRIVIHASRRKDAEGKHLFQYLQDYKLFPWTCTWDELPRGVLVGSVFVDGVYRTEDVAEEITEYDRLCGNFEAGRFAYRGSDPELFKRLVPWKGMLGIMNIPAAIYEEARR